jgi:hypothetical protein
LNEEGTAIGPVSSGAATDAASDAALRCVALVIQHRFKPTLYDSQRQQRTMTLHSAA